MPLPLRPLFRHCRVRASSCSFPPRMNPENGDLLRFDDNKSEITGITQHHATMIPLPTQSGSGLVTAKWDCVLRAHGIGIGQEFSSDVPAEDQRAIELEIIKTGTF